MDRRTLLRTAAWSVPVIGLAVAAPAATASVIPDPPLVCTVAGGDVEVVLVTDATVTIVFRPTATNAVDVTLRWSDGTSDWHRNFVTQGVNPGDNQILYSPGQTVVIPTHARPTWFQVQGIHYVNCAVTP